MENRMIRCYELETGLLRLSGRREEIRKALKQAKYDLRQAQQEQTLYGGSFRGFLDRISGKQEEKQEALRRAVNAAQSVLESLEREKESLSAQERQLETERSSLPDAATLRDRALEQPDSAQRWAALEAKYCAEALRPLLEKTEAALEDYRALLRGQRSGEIISHEERHEIGTAYIGWTNQCLPLLQRLKQAADILKQPVEIGRYFENPSGFLASAAARHNQLDRMNEALAQVASARRQAKLFSEAE